MCLPNKEYLPWKFKLRHIKAWSTLRLFWTFLRDLIISLQWFVKWTFADVQVRLLFLGYITQEGSIELYISLRLMAIFSLLCQICVKRCLHVYLLPVCLNVNLDSPTRSMICLMVWRRMIPELFWSVPASLGSLSAQDKWIESLHHIGTRDKQQ